MPILVDCEQGSVEWMAARLGVPSASQFHRIVTPKKVELSAQSDEYAGELLAAWALGVPAGKDAADFMEHGKACEPSAIADYEIRLGVEVERVGFILEDGGRYGCSPDGLVGNTGGVEIKSPAAHTHIGYLLDADLSGKYRCQVQGALLVTERDWWDWMAFHPSLPPVMLRFGRDEKFIAALKVALDQFAEVLERGKEILREKGVVPISPTESGLLHGKISTLRDLEGVLA